MEWLKELGSFCDVTDYTIDGKCSNCGQCCSNLLPMSDAEIRRIMDYLKKNPVKEQFQRALVSINQTDMTCPFRDNVNRKCLIYSVRPAICREFMCNYRRERIVNKRNELYSSNRRIVFMRAQFFENPEDIKFLLGFNDWYKAVINNDF